MSVHISIVVDNEVYHEDCLSEHGFMAFISVNGGSFFFDAGRTIDCVRNNLHFFGLSPRAADIIVLSHGHYDHTGALSYLIEGNPQLRVICHSDCFGPHLSGNRQGPLRDIGCPMPRSLIPNLELVTELTSVLPSVYCTGPIALEKRHPLEDTGGKFYTSLEHDLDPLLDDQSIIIDSVNGLIIICGCCHSGLLSTINFVLELPQFSQKSIDLIIGGFHLIRASQDRLDATVDLLNEIGVRRIAPCHCTGTDATQFLIQHFEGEVISVGAGWHCVL